jgi:hypothetical protein
MLEINLNTVDIIFRPYLNIYLLLSYGAASQPT